MWRDGSYWRTKPLGKKTRWYWGKIFTLSKKNQPRWLRYIHSNNPHEFFALKCEFYNHKTSSTVNTRVWNQACLAPNPKFFPYTTVELHSWLQHCHPLSLSLTPNPTHQISMTGEEVRKKKKLLFKEHLLFTINFRYKELWNPKNKANWQCISTWARE